MTFVCVRACVWWGKGGGERCSGIKQEGQRPPRPAEFELLAPCSTPYPECGALSPPGGWSGHCIGRLDPAAWGGMQGAALFAQRLMNPQEVWVTSRHGAEVGEKERGWCMGNRCLKVN